MTVAPPPLLIDLRSDTVTAARIILETVK